jgi:hypothetical protein
MADRTRRKRMRIFVGKIEVRNVELLEVRGISYTVGGQKSARFSHFTAKLDLLTPLNFN